MNSSVNLPRLSPSGQVLTRELEGTFMTSGMPHLFKHILVDVRLLILRRAVDRIR